MKRSLKQWSEQILKHWQDKFDEDEWYFSDEEERLLHGLKPWEAAVFDVHRHVLEEHNTEGHLVERQMQSVADLK